MNYIQTKKTNKQKKHSQTNAKVDIIIQGLGLALFFHVFEKSLFWSPRLHLFDQKNTTNC